MELRYFFTKQISLWIRNPRLVSLSLLLFILNQITSTLVNQIPLTLFIKRTSHYK